MTLEPPLSTEIVGFWREAGPKRWFKRDADFDAEIRNRYEAVHMAAAAGTYADWEATAEGALGLLLLLDQFPRNLYRDTGHAFATDGIARRVATTLIAQGLDREIEPALRPFAYMPFVHHEAPDGQACGVELFERYTAETGQGDNLRYARLHQDVITRFGRFPHRNAALGRETTAEEWAFLKGGGFRG